MNLINIVNLFKQFSDKHPGVQRFKNDTTDKISLFCNEKESFPVLYSTLINNYNLKYDNGFRASRFVFEVNVLVPKIMLTPEQDNDILLNQTNVNLSECINIITDLFNAIEGLDLIEIIGDVNATYKNNYGGDLLQGVTAIFTLDMEDDDVCESPLTSPLVFESFRCNNLQPELYFLPGYIDENYTE